MPPVSYIGTDGIFYFEPWEKENYRANLEKILYISIIAYFSGALIILIISLQNTALSCHHQAHPKAALSVFYSG
jgi:hypothetical protein